MHQDAIRTGARIVVAGSSGRIGRRLRRVWSGPVYAARRPGAHLAWDPMDGPAGIAPVAGADAMILLSGVVSAEAGDLARNAELALAAEAACRAHGIGRLLAASTSAVYGTGAGEPMDEAAPLRPVSDYGRAKIDMEEALAARPPGGPEICCLRIGNVAGADALLTAALEATPERPLRLDRFASGRSPRRSYIGTVDLARVLGALAGAPGPLPFALNVAAPRPVYMGELLEAADVPWRDRPAPPGALQDITLDTARLDALAPLPEAASEPAEIVRQWRLSGPAA